MRKTGIQELKSASICEICGSWLWIDGMGIRFGQSGSSALPFSVFRLVNVYHGAGTENFRFNQLEVQRLAELFK